MRHGAPLQAHRSYNTAMPASLKNILRPVVRIVREKQHQRALWLQNQAYKPVFDEIYALPQRSAAMPVSNTLPNNAGVAHAHRWGSAQEIIGEFSDVERRSVDSGEYGGWAPDDAVWDEATQQHELWSFAPLAKFLTSLRPGGTVLEMGCGAAHLFTLMSRLGISGYVGLDGHPQFVELNPLLHNYKGHFHVLDLQQEIDFKTAFDLIVSFEVLEHIQEDRVGTFIQTMANHADTNTLIICTASTVDAYDVHVTVKPREWWLQKFRQHGLKPATNADEISAAVGDAHPFNWSPDNTNIFVLVKAPIC